MGCVCFEKEWIEWKCLTKGFEGNFEIKKRLSGPETSKIRMNGPLTSNLALRGPLVSELRIKGPKVSDFKGLILFWGYFASFDS